MEGGRNITAILTGGIVKGFEETGDSMGSWWVAEILQLY
jgi:hypothetical protein